MSAGDTAVRAIALRNARDESDSAARAPGAPTNHLLDGQILADFFPDTIPPPDPLIGRAVTMDTPCRACGSATALIGPGGGPHLGELRCSSCNKHRQWIGRSSYTAIAKFVAKIADTFGAPETIKFIKDRRSESHPCASGTTFSDGRAISAAIRSQHTRSLHAYPAWSRRKRTDAEIRRAYELAMAEKRAAKFKSGQNEPTPFNDPIGF
jgi:hypothetical protein